VYERILAGASLVQVYTGFVYGGPRFVGRLLAGLLELLQRDGYRGVGEAVGRAESLASIDVNG
jgi:dihydroorotate dehydrogenase